LGQAIFRVFKCYTLGVEFADFGPKFGGCGKGDLADMIWEMLKRMSRKSTLPVASEVELLINSLRAQKFKIVSPLFGINY